MRKLLFAAAIVVLAWAALVVPLLFAVMEPLPAMPLGDIVELEDGLPQGMPDELHFTAVQLQQPTTVGAAQVVLDEHRELTIGRAIVPPDIDPEQFQEFQRRLFRESVRAAVAMGLQEAGEDVTVSGDGARVIAVVPGAPADLEVIGVASLTETIEALADS